jgi:hypothetical protein
MANVNEFDANRVMQEFSKIAPFALILCALLSFISVGVFCVDYYDSLFKERFDEYSMSMAVMVAVIQELVRFGLLIASIRDFSDKKPFNGWLGLVGSVGLVFHDISICKDIATVWSPENPSLYSDIFVFLILIGFLLEIRLVLTIRNASFSKSSAVGKSKESQRSNGVYQTA